MPLKLRPTSLGSGIDKDRPDYTVFIGEWEIGRIYQTRGGPRPSALVLVDERERSDDALRSCGDLGGSQGAISQELGRVEGVGRAGEVPWCLVRWLGRGREMSCRVVRRSG